MSAPIACRPATWMFTGRAPIAQPPGSETSALPKRASSGPSTRIEARMVFTSSYGAKYSRVVEASISMRIFSSMVTETPMRPNNSIIVVTSCRCGTLRIVTGPSARSAPATMGSVAFFAPEIRTSPSSGMPPLICSLSTFYLQETGSDPGFGGGQCLDRQRMDFPAHELAERLIYELVARDGSQTCELAGHDPRGEMSVVAGFHVHLGAGQSGTDQVGDAV